MTAPADFEHAIKNHLAIIVGYADLLLDECGADDQRRPDILEMRKAANAALALVDTWVGSAR